MNVYLKKQNFFWQKMFLRVGVLLLLVVGLNLFQPLVRNSVYQLSSPFSGRFLAAGNATASVVNSLVNINSLTQDNERLREENEYLLSQITAFQDNARQNAALAVALENTASDDYNILSAKVIGLNGIDDILTINKGLADGIAENMPVISKEKVLYGKVLKVYENFSEILLVSSKKSVVDVKINHTDTAIEPVHGVVKGNGNFSAYLDLVSSDSQIAKEEVVATSALEGTFPPDLLVGKIISTEQNDAKPFQTAELELFFNGKNTDSIFVITNYKKK